MESWQYHPMGSLILLMFLAIAATSVMPLWRRILVRQIESNAKLFNIVYLAFVLAFVSFGLIRALLRFPHLW